MRQTIRALGWAIKIIWIVTLLLPVTVALSLWDLFSSGAFGVREPAMSLSDTALSILAPFYINNTGFYDLSDVNITIKIMNNNNRIAEFSKLFPKVPAKSMLNATYDVSLDLEELFSDNRELLTHDADLDLAVSAFLRVAYAIGFGVSANTTMNWGAPFKNLMISNMFYNAFTQEFSFSLSFENHATFPISGELKVEAVNALNEIIGYTTQLMDVASGAFFEANLTIPVDLSKKIDPCVFRVYFSNIQILEVGWS